jgi:hypothetical protein
MKIRITGNKLRIRLKEPEVQRLYKGEKISEVLQFGVEPDQQLRFLLQTDDEQALGVAFNEGAISVSVPIAFSKELAETNRVGFEADISTGVGKNIYVLIEKDFECLDAPEEDNNGSYPNPKTSC